MKIERDKTLLGLGVWWTKPDIVCQHHLLTVHLGPYIWTVYDEHERIKNETSVETKPEEMSFR